MATRVWGPFHIIVILAIRNSALANANAGMNAASRMLYAMGRVRILPSVLVRLNKNSVPGLAIILVSIVSIVLSLVPGILYGPTVGFAFLGATLTLPIIIFWLGTHAPEWLAASSKVYVEDEDVQPVHEVQDLS